MQLPELLEVLNGQLIVPPLDFALKLPCTNPVDTGSVTVATVTQFGVPPPEYLCTKYDRPDTGAPPDDCVDGVHDRLIWFCETADSVNPLGVFGVFG